jgi:heptosyltransferase-2
MELLILKIGALGDVLRTTTILPGLRKAYPGVRVTWLTGQGAEDLLRLHPLLERVVTVDPDSADARERVVAELAGIEWGRILSLDDDEPVCALASALAADRAAGVLSGAYLDGDGTRTYTQDTAPWFEMGLISKLGREEADARKRHNTETHRAIFARMLGIEPGESRLELTPEAQELAERILAEASPVGGGPLIGINTGAGGRWASKRLDVERTVELIVELDRRLAHARFVLLGGAGESARNAEILARCEGPELLHAGVENGLLEFAALISRLDLIVTSDSLALHVAVARRVPVVVFFAPTSAAEIELHGRGEKVISLAADAGSYRGDADTSTLTVERLAHAAERTLARHRSP